MTNALSLLARPFHTSEFDFGSVSYFEEINTMGEAFVKDSALRKVNAARWKQGLVIHHALLFWDLSALAPTWG